MEALQHRIDAAVTAKDFSTIQRIFSVDWNAIGQGEQRSLASHFICTVVASDCDAFLSQALPVLEDTLLTVLGHLPATVDNAADNTLRQAIFEHKTQQGAYADAARVLAGLRLEAEDTTSVYYMPPHERMDVYVKIAECFLAEDLVAESDAAVTKAGSIVVPASDQHTDLILRYKSTYARVLDANRKFLQAAQRYHELSQDQHNRIEDDELLLMLGRAATCAILAPSGSQKGRLLHLLCQDERLDTLSALPDHAPHATLCRQMHGHQIIRPGNAVTSFQQTLSEHQTATMGDGLTILERALIEHNMTAVANVYQSIWLHELATILGVSAQKAERMAASMIMEGTIVGYIDQVEGVLILEDAPRDEETTTLSRATAAFCVELNRAVEAVRSSDT